MQDPRIKKLAHILVHYSTKLQKGERVLIQNSGTSTHDLVKAVIKTVYEAGAEPHVLHTDPSILREILLQCTEKQMNFMAEYSLQCMRGVDAYIGIRSWDNVNEMADLPEKNSLIYRKNFFQPVHIEQRVNHTKWVVLRYPNHAMAQLAKMSLESFENFYFNSCNIDYEKMSAGMDGLVALMSKTDRVHIKGPGTDLTFSIKGIPIIKCDGRRNIPDGEVYTAPIRDSVNGVLAYNCPSLCEEEGIVFENVRFEFKDGKIVKAESNNTQRLNKILDTDEGARYIGEFALGCNPSIDTPIQDSLFDEKITGSFHFTPGNCYKLAENGNHSAIHWDLVNIQTPQYGGGEMYFDGVLVRKDGKFVLEECAALNPENCKY